MTGPHEHDDDATGKLDESAVPEQPNADAASPTEPALDEAAQQRLNEAEAWAPDEQWQPRSWEPTTPEVIERMEVEVAAEVDAPAQTEPAVTEAPDVADIIAAAEAKAPTPVGDGPVGEDLPSQPAASAGPTGSVGSAGSTAGDEPSRTVESNEPNGPVEPNEPPATTQAFAPIAPVGGGSAELPPLSPYDAATSALPVVPGDGSGPAGTEPGTEPGAAAGDPARPGTGPTGDTTVAGAATGFEAPTAAPTGVDPTPGPTPEPEPTTAELAAAFPSTPYGHDPRPAAATPSDSDATAAVPILLPGQTPAGADLDATIIGGPLLTGAAVPPQQDGYGQAPLAAPAKRPRGADRKAPPAPKTPVWALLVGALVAVAIIVGGILLVVKPWEDPNPAPSVNTGQATAPTQNQGESPADVTEAFSRALIEGDATTALGFLSQRTTAAQRDVSDELLDNAHYAKATNRPSSVEIDPASKAPVAADTNRAKVTATLTQAGKPVETVFTLTRTTSTSPWKVDPGMLPTVRVAGASGTTIKINGQDVAVPGTAGDYVTTGFRVLPGTYSVEGKGDSFTSFGKAVKGNASVTTVGQDPKATVGTATLKPKRTEKFEEAATEAVDAWLDTCQASTEMKPKDCPFQAAATFEGATVTDVKWSIDTRPQLTFQDYDLGIDEVNGTGGKATVTGKAKVGGEEKVIKGTVEDFSFRGTLEIKGKKVTFTPAS